MIKVVDVELVRASIARSISHGVICKMHVLLRMKLSCFFTILKQERKKLASRFCFLLSSSLLERETTRVKAIGDEKGV